MPNFKIIGLSGSVLQRGGRIRPPPPPAVLGLKKPGLFRVKNLYLFLPEKPKYFHIIYLQCHKGEEEESVILFIYSVIKEKRKNL